MAHAKSLGGLAHGVALTLSAATLHAGSIVVFRRQQAHPNGSPSPRIMMTIQLIVSAIISSGFVNPSGTRRGNLSGTH